MDITEEKIRKVIDKLIEMLKEDSDRWENEQMIHYEFFKLLFDEFSPEEVKNSFRWEYPVGVPSKGTGKTPARVDMIFKGDDNLWIAIEIEYVSPGIELENELYTCIDKLKTASECIKYMKKGFILPLLARKADKKARGYGKTYQQLCIKILNDVKKEIDNFPIEIIEDGIVLF